MHIIDQQSQIENSLHNDYTIFIIFLNKEWFEHILDS